MWLEFYFILDVYNLKTSKCDHSYDYYWSILIILLRFYSQKKISTIAYGSDDLGTNIYHGIISLTQPSLLVHTFQ